MNRIKAYIWKIGKVFERIVRFVSEDMWKINTDSFSRSKQRLIMYLKVITLSLKTFAERGIGFQSVALSYFCMMAVIPFVAICFIVTNGFGMGNWLKDFLSTIIPADDGLVDMILGAAANILDLSKSGVFGAMSALLFVWAVIWMMMRVEKVFNNVWGVKKPERKFITSFSVELGLLIILPFLAAFFFVSSVLYSNVTDLLIPDIYHWIDGIKTIFGWLIFGAAMVMLFAAMYKFIPAVKVKFKYAFWAALLSGVAFTVLQYLYIETQIMVARLNAVYGVIAVIPLFMIWLRYSWLIILYGAQFTYSFQMLGETETENQ